MNILKSTILYVMILFALSVTTATRGAEPQSDVIKLELTNLTDEYKKPLTSRFNECKGSLEDYLRKVPSAGQPAEIWTRYDDEQRMLITVLSIPLNLPEIPRFVKTVPEPYSPPSFGDDVFGYDPESHAINIHPVAAMLEHLHNYYVNSGYDKLLAIKFVKPNGDYASFIAKPYQNIRKIFKLEPFILIGTAEGTYTINSACPVLMNTLAQKFCIPNPRLPSGKKNEATLVWEFFKINYDTPDISSGGK